MPETETGELEALTDLRDGVRSYGPGLRAQILFALAIGFVLSVVSLGFATSRLGRRAAQTERRAHARTLAELMILAPESQLESLASDAMGQPGVVGLDIRRGSFVLRRGALEEVFVEVERSGWTARIHLGHDARSDDPLSDLLFFYVGLTAAALLLLSYVLLTRLIVRPVEELTRATERMRAGKMREVPMMGGGELARLAVSFNRMQRALRDEHRALEARLIELQELTEQLQRTQHSLMRSEKLASVGRLAAGLAHEIGNPLTSIAGLIDLVADGGLEPEQASEFLRRAQRETERIHHIIRDLLDFARADSESGSGASSDLREVVEDAVRLIGPQKDLSRIDIERRFETDVPLAVGASSQLAQVVLNLLLNAADSIGGDGAIVVEVGEADEEYVELSVSDTGSGIDESVLSTLFEPFVTTKAAGAGTGLGLAVCHSLVEQLGGVLRAENLPQGGARFTMSLPRAPESSTA